MSATGLNDVLQYIAYGFPLSAVRLVPSAVACCGFNGVRKKKRMRRTTKAPVGAKAARSGKKWSPGLCMARREFLLYSRARRFAAPCRVGYETGEKLRKAAVESSSGKRQWNGLFQSSAPPQIRPVAEILGRGEQVAGCVHQFRSLRARPLLNGRRVAAGRSRRSGTVGNIR